MQWLRSLLCQSRVCTYMKKCVLEKRIQYKELFYKQDILTLMFAKTFPFELTLVKHFLIHVDNRAAVGMSISEPGTAYAHSFKKYQNAEPLLLLPLLPPHHI